MKSKTIFMAARVPMILSEAWTHLFVRSSLPRGSPPELPCVLKTLVNYIEVTDTPDGPFRKATVCVAINPSPPCWTASFEVILASLGRILGERLWGSPSGNSEKSMKNSESFACNELSAS